MRPRRELIWLVLTGVCASAFGMVAAVGLTAAPAHACSVAAPTAVVEPSSNVRAGDWVSITGWGFWDLVWDASQQAQTQPAPDQVDTAAVPPPFCDFTTFPMSSVAVTWVGESKQVLGTVDGPEFEIAVQIPRDGTTGAAAIVIGELWVDVWMGPVVDPPPPCGDLAHQAIVSQWCPEPPPCVLYGQPAPAPNSLAAQVAPPECPCAGYSAGGDRGTDHARAWDCPPPCEERRPDSARAPGECPPVPCELIGGDAWNCPDPCPVYLAEDAVHQTPTVCPDPCGGAVDGFAVWCPPPCLDGQPDTGTSPGPCPPGPCELVGGDAWDCPPESAAAVVVGYTVPAGIEEADAGPADAVPEAVPVDTTSMDVVAGNTVSRNGHDSRPAGAAFDSPQLPIGAQDSGEVSPSSPAASTRNSQSEVLLDLLNRAVRNVVLALFG